MGKPLQIIAIALAISIATFIQTSMASNTATGDVACVRKSHSALGFTGAHVFDRWFPNVIYFYHDEAQPAERGRLTFGDKSGYYFDEGTSYWLASGIKWEMLPDGRLFAHFPQKPGYKQIETQRYLCSKTVAEILANQ